MDRGGRRVYKELHSPHVTRTALFPSPPTVIVAHSQNGPCVDARYEREGWAVPPFPGHDPSAVSGLEVTTEGEGTNSPPEEKGQEVGCALWRV
jgi:hypothetical protein